VRQSKRGILISRFILAFALTVGSARAQESIHDTALARVEALALLQTLNADLLSHDSATLTLERWCGTHHLAADSRLHAELVHGQDKALTAAQRKELGISAEEPVRYRRVRLSCGGHVLSEADNWYVPRLLTPDMNRQLDETDTPFGRVVLSLGFTRHTLAVDLLWRPLPAGWEAEALPADGPGTLPIPQEVLQHRAVLTTRNGTPFCEVVETYQRAMFAFSLPGD
jgi:chorismate-pyruvate lyase